MKHETQQSIGLWADGVFGREGVTLSRQLARAFEELDELALECAESPDRLEECADVAICLIVYAHRAGIETPPLHPILQTAVDAKMVVNRRRKWAIRGDGTGYHIKPSTPPLDGGGAG